LLRLPTAYIVNEIRKCPEERSLKKEKACKKGNSVKIIIIFKKVLQRYGQVKKEAGLEMGEAGEKRGARKKRGGKTGL